MRILILTHARSGATSLMSWIAFELGYKLIYHEPNLQDSKIYEKVISEENIIVKIFPSDIEAMSIDVSKLVQTFDKIIYHIRESIKDTSISIVAGNQNNNNEVESKWHEPYVITDEWLIKNEQEIDNSYDTVKFLINKVKDLVHLGGLKTTYENIFETKSDIFELCSFLDIKDPIYLDIIHNRRKLKNGTIGMKDLYKLNKEIQIKNDDFEIVLEKRKLI